METGLQYTMVKKVRKKSNHIDLSRIINKEFRWIWLSKLLFKLSEEYFIEYTDYKKLEFTAQSKWIVARLLNDYGLKVHSL